MDNRATIHCPWCQLNQFQTVSGNCRRCKRPLAVEAIAQKPDEMHDTPSSLSTDYSRVGVTVRLIRLAQGVTQEELARRMGVFRTFLSKIEFGKIRSPTIDTTYKLAAALGITAYGLVEIAEHIR